MVVRGNSSWRTIVDDYHYPCPACADPAPHFARIDDDVIKLGYGLASILLSVGAFLLIGLLTDDKFWNAAGFCVTIAAAAHYYKELRISGKW